MTDRIEIWQYFLGVGVGLMIGVALALLLIWVVVKIGDWWENW